MGRWELLFIALVGLAAVIAQQEKRRTGNVCKEDMECPDNAFCKMSSFCVCKDGYIFSTVNETHKGCLKEGRIGEECIQSVQCHAIMGLHAECYNGLCRCHLNSHVDNDTGRCYENALVGERCISDQNCFLGNGPRMAYCVRGYCSCELAYSPRDNGTRCVPDAALGDPCEDELQCAGPGLECRDKCQCKENWVEYAPHKMCIESVKGLGEPCEFDAQCDAFAGSSDVPSPGAALCLGGTCSCSYSAHAAGRPLRCWHSRRPGQGCKRDEECVSEEGEPGYCLSGVCTCKTCSPDASDFGGASSLPRPPLYAASLIAIAALLRH